MTKRPVDARYCSCMGLAAQTVCYQRDTRAIVGVFECIALRRLTGKDDVLHTPMAESVSQDGES